MEKYYIDDILKNTNFTEDCFAKIHFLERRVGLGYKSTHQLFDLKKCDIFDLRQIKRKRKNKSHVNEYSSDDK